MRATSYQEVVSGALDNPQQRFATAVEMTLSGMRRLYDDEAIIGATIFGSAVSRDEYQEADIDPLSDVDVFLIAADNRVTRAMRGCRDIAEAVIKETAVALELGWLTEADARIGGHAMLPPMHIWLGTQRALYPTMTVGTAPAEVIRPADINAVTEVDTWFRSTCNNLSKADRPFDTQIALALSIPHIAARKSIGILRYLDVNDRLAIPKPRSPHHTKDEVAAIAYHVYGERDNALCERYQELQLIKTAYLGFLTNVVSKGMVSEIGYNNTIQEMAVDAVPQVRELLQRMRAQFGAMAMELCITQ